MYKVTQYTTKNRLFFGTKEVKKVYNFDSYNNALIFALNEQIKHFKCIISDSIAINRNTFVNVYTCKEWVKLARKNPMHYISLQSAKGIALERLYYYYINSGKMHKIRKH